jgi:flagellar hook capping protein FlgD
MRHLTFCFLTATGLVASPILPTALHAQSPDSARYRIYLTVTDSVTKLSAKASFGFHPGATLDIDSDTLFGFKDHWYESDSPWVHEVYPPPVAVTEDLRINNCRQKISNNGTPFGNIHAYTGPSMVDTFVVIWNAPSSSAGDSLYLYTHPQILSWPSVLRYYADSIILRDIQDLAKTTAGPYVRVDMTRDLSYTYFGEYYNKGPDIGLYAVDPLNRGFFVYVYHPKISPAPPDRVSLVSPPNGSTEQGLNPTLQWNPSEGASSYKLELDTNRTFRHPLFIDTPLSNAETIDGLAVDRWYYWRVLVSNPYGVSYYQDPPDSFKTTSVTGVKNTGGQMPYTFALSQNYPNPFNPSTRIEFGVPSPARLRIEVYDALGRSISTLARGDYIQGNYTVDWNGTDGRGSPLPSGVYFARMIVDAGTVADGPGSFAQNVIRMIVLR